MEKFKEFFGINDYWAGIYVGMWIGGAATLIVTAAAMIWPYMGLSALIVIAAWTIIEVFT